MSVRKVLLHVATAVCLAGSLAACGPQSERTQSATEADAGAEAAPLATEAVVASESPSAEPTPTASPTPSAVPVVEIKQVTVTQSIAFKKSTIKDASLTVGTRKLRTKGVAGVKTLTFEVTYTDGKETGRKLLREAVTKTPRTEVTAIGTKKKAPTRQCDPNYSGCVPIAEDVDCLPGSGDGPAYVRGPIKVTGDDIYGLDRDGDGIACE